jgi:hypothetical protein
MNALKHGILSNHLFISAEGEGTDYEAFTDFMAHFFEEMQPVGLLETILVDRLLSTHWRLRRLHIAETGFISKQVDPHFMQQFLQKIEEQGIARNDVENGFFRRMRTSKGCSDLADHWQVVSENLEQHGLPLSKGWANRVEKELGGNSGFFKAEYVYYCNYIVVNNGVTKTLTVEDEKQFNELALKYAKDLQKFFRDVADILKMDEKDVQKADLQSKMIPPLDVVEKIQRYDAHLQRIFLQTLHELQRIQSKRLGEAPPLAAALDVTVDADNGFVS